VPSALSPQRATAKQPESPRVRTADAQSKGLISNPGKPPTSVAAAKSLKLEYSVVTSHFADRRKEAVKQQQLIRDSDVWWDQIGHKLAGRLKGTQCENQYANFARCGQEPVFQICKCCGQVQEHQYHCSIKWCPRCNWRITRTRQQTLQLWIQTIKQPKHLVLTQRNFENLTRETIRCHTRHLAAIRRTRSFDQVNGGCVSVEITNKGEGWHLHSHWLLDARFIPQDEVAIAWGKLVGQEYGIVKVKDLRDRKEYQREVSKYVVKGSEMACWPPDQLAQFVQAVRGQRFFFKFGSLMKHTEAIKAQLKFLKPSPPSCECGMRSFKFESGFQAIVNQLRKEKRR